MKPERVNGIGSPYQSRKRRPDPSENRQVLQRDRSAGILIPISILISLQVCCTLTRADDLRGSGCCASRAERRFYCKRTNAFQAVCRSMPTLLIPRIQIACVQHVDARPRRCDYVHGSPITLLHRAMDLEEKRSRPQACELESRSPGREEAPPPVSYFPLFVVNLQRPIYRAYNFLFARIRLQRSTFI